MSAFVTVCVCICGVVRVADSRASAGKTLELYSGTHFVKFSREWFETQVKWLRMDLEEDEGDEALRQLPIAEATLYNSLLKDDRYLYMPVDGPIGWNSGILGQVNADMVSRYDKQPGRSYICEPMLHAHQQCRMFNIFLRNSIETDSDPFFEFREGESPPVADLIWLTNNDSHLSALSLSLRKSINRVVHDSGLKFSNRGLIKQEEVMRSYGASTHPLHEQIHNTMNSSALKLVANTMFTTFAYNVRSAITGGEISVLKNVAFAMKSCLEYRNYGTVRGERWIKDYAHFRVELDIQDKCLGGAMLNDCSINAVWQAYARKRLELDLSWCNEHLVETLQDSAVATFCWQPKQWGSPVKVADMAHHCTILKIISKHVHVPFIVDWKSPSAGIDSSINQMGDVNNAWGAYCSISTELQQFYDSSFSHDHTAGHMSNLSISTWLGCGVALNSDGTVDFEATSFRDDLFLSGYLTEHKKDQASSAASEDKAGVCYLHTHAHCL